MKEKIFINARIIDPSQSMDEKGSLILNDKGKVKAIGKSVKKPDANKDAEIIDLRGLVPLDIDTITKSIEKTGRCVIVHEAPKTSGFGGELSAQVQELCFYHLEAPIVRVTGWDTPFPHSLEWHYFPRQKRVIEAMKKVVED